MVAASLPPFVQSLRMADAQVGYAVGGRQTSTVFHLYRTADGGRRWTLLRTAAPAAPPTPVGRAVVFFPTRVHGAVVVERSGDGGRTWHASAPIRSRRAVGPGSVVAIDARHLLLPLGEGAAAGSSASSLWRSGDGGRTWRFVSRTGTSPGALPFSCDKTGVGFATPARGFAGGACAGGPAFLYRTGDGGRTWRRVPLAGLARCACETSAPVFFGPHDGAFAVVGFPQSGSMAPVARVYWTRDGGARWTVTRPPLGRTGPASFANGGVAWVAGTAPGRIRTPFSRLARTADGGRRWRVVTPPFDGQQVQLDAVSAQVAYAVGERRVLRTVDGGRTWHAVG